MLDRLDHTDPWLQEFERLDRLLRRQGLPLLLHPLCHDSFSNDISLLLDHLGLLDLAHSLLTNTAVLLTLTKAVALLAPAVSSTDLGAAESSTNLCLADTSWSAWRVVKTKLGNLGFRQ